MLGAVSGADRRPLVERRLLGVSVRLLIEVPAASLLLYAFLLKLKMTRGNVVWDRSMLTTVRLEGAFVVALLVLLALAFPRRRLAAQAVVYAIASLLMLVCATYAAYAGGILTVRDVVLAGQVPAVWSSVEALVSAFWVNYLWDLVPVLVAALVGSHLLAKGRTGRRAPSLWIIAGVSTAVCIALVVRVFALPVGVDDIAAARARGLLAWQVAATFRAQSALAPGEVPDDPHALQALIEQVIDRRTDQRLADFEPGVAAGSSVIIVQMEAVQSFAVGLRVSGRSVTPNLDRLIEQSWYFPNTYSQVRKGTTADAEFVVNTSLYAPHAAASPIAYADRELTSMPRLLAAEGYRTVAFHTNTATFWNRIRMMPALGFDTFYDRSYFGEEDVIGFGASDEVLYDRAMDVLLGLDSSGTRFYAYLISVTSHHPFAELPASKRPLELPAPYAGTFVGRYLQSIEYADRALGLFLEEYERSGLSERCTLVIIGDHFGISPREPQTRDGSALEAALGRPYDAVDAMRVPLIVRLPGQAAGGVIAETVGQVDIMPTLADVLGLDISGTPHFGASAFVRHTTLMQGCGTVTPGAFLTDSVAVLPGIDADSGTVIDLTTHRVLDPNAVSEDALERVRRLGTISDAYVRSLPRVTDHPLGE